MIVLKNTPINQIFYILRNSKNGSGCWDLTHSNVEYNSNGTFTIAPPEGYDGLSSVTVKVDVKCSGITTSESEINSSNDGGDYTIGISSGYSWTATASEDWITVTPSSGEGGVAVVVITVSENEGDERTGTVTIVNDNGDVNVIEITQESGTASIPLTIEAITDGTLSIKCGQNHQARTIEYSIDDGGTWNSVTSSTSRTEIASLKAGDKVQLRGDNVSYYGNNLAYTGDFNVSGNIMSLISSTNYRELTELQGSSTFSYLFGYQSGLINAENLLLPATTLSENCYDGMFQYCSNLATTPILPATTLAPRCYWEMFRYTGITEAPALPATALAESCYDSMFTGCTNLTKAPELPATTLASQCYGNMFGSCTNLTQAPELPATTLALKCYEWMFQECTNLTQAPELPATTLANLCYRYMFYKCTSLEKAPELPATTMVYGCYKSMFDGCTNLTTPPELPATTLAQSCYSYMFEDCKQLTTAPLLPAATLVKYCYNSMFYGCSKLNYIKCLATVFPEDICTERFTLYVSPTGTFVCPDPSVWTTGTDGIPSGWTVETI